MNQINNFHRLPKDVAKLQAWKNAISSSGEKSTNAGHICIEHFEKADIKGSGERTYLTVKAKPTIFNNGNEMVIDANGMDGSSMNEMETGDTMGKDLNRLKKLLDQEKKINRELRQEIEKRDVVIKNLSSVLKNFQTNNLSQFAVRASENSKVGIFKIFPNLPLYSLRQLDCQLKKTPITTITFMVFINFYVSNCNGN